MKTIIALFFWLTFSLCGFSQMVFSDPVKFNERTSSYIGMDDDFCYFVTAQPLGYGAESKKYLKVNAKTGVALVIDDIETEFEGKNGRLISAKIVDGELIEIYSVAQGNITTKSKIYFVKRDPSNFSLKGNPKFIKENYIFSSEFMPSIKVLFDDNGFYLVGQQPGKKGDAFLTRFDYAFNELWSEDHTQFYPESGQVVSDVYLDPKNSALIYILNLKKADDINFFKYMVSKEKLVNSVITGILIYNNEGNRKAYVPTFNESLVFSMAKYNFNDSDSTLTGYFITHQAGRDESSVATGLGLATYSWDLTDTTVTKVTSQVLTFMDVLGESGKVLLDKAGVSYPDLNTIKFPRNRVVSGYDFLSTDYYATKSGKVLYVIKGLGGLTTDFNRKEEINEQLFRCNYLVLFDEKGNLKWTLFDDHLRSEENRVIVDSENEQIVVIYKANSSNYVGNKYNLNQTDVQPDIFGYSVIDMSTGEYKLRTSLGPIVKKHEFNRFSKIHQNSGNLLFSISKETGSITPVSFSLVNIQQ